VTRACLVALALAQAAGCATAVGPAVQADMVARQQSAQPAITQCYAKALETNPRLRGVMVIAFAVAPQTGQFVDLAVRRDDLRDPALGQCVFEAIAQLHLASPLTSRTVSSFPIRFAPTR
jgi:hypothetical protein